jgi:hypothetical protein
VNRDNRFCPRRYRRLELVRRKVVILSDINEDWSGSSVNDGGYRRYKRVPHGNDFVARPNSRSQQGKMQCVIAAVHSNRVLDAYEVREVLLEISQLLS